ncbi:MAG: methylated-DNA--[protein]-cysteine S-methyltransferase [Atopostipes suicloacalis]|nr:methylated-DNA--[protein]-cysteine S-methyltransferase [Atopostipes suicloacalis]
MSTLYIDKVKSKIWSGFLVVSKNGLAYVSHHTKDLRDVTNWQSKHYPDSILVSDSKKVALYKKQFEEYLAGQRYEFNFPVDLNGTAFQMEVWKALLDIPYGQTASYLDLAHQLNRDSKSTQAIGGAVAANPLSIIYPCHRVVGNDGSLTGYAGGLDIKRDLLNHELEYAFKIYN